MRASSGASLLVLPQVKGGEREELLAPVVPAGEMLAPELLDGAGAERRLMLEEDGGDALLPDGARPGAKRHEERLLAPAHYRGGKMALGRALVRDLAARERDAVRDRQRLDEPHELEIEHRHAR